MKLVAKWLALPLIALLVITGCTAVGGLEIQKAIQANIKTTSSESNQIVKFELEPASDNISKEDKEIIDLINSISLNIDSAKVQSANELSVKGSISYLGKKLPLHLSLDEKAMVFQIEGAKKPFSISLEDDSLASFDVQKYEKQVEELTSKIYEIVLKHLPNPKNITVKSVQDSINGQSLNLTQLHIELNAEEMLGLVKPFLTSLSKDEAGLKDLISVVYDFIEEVNSEVGSSDLGNKEINVAMAYTFIQEGIKEVLANYDTGLANLFEQTPELKTILGKDTHLKADIYFDNSLKIRKQHMEFKVAFPASDDIPVKSFKVISDSEVWNIGGDVKADKVDVSGGVLEINSDPYEMSLTPGTVLRNFEPSSEVYDVLKNQMKITEKEFLIDSESDYYNVIKKQGTTFMPLRDVSERLDAEVKWTKGSKDITIVDDITGNEIVFTVDSNKAVVAGKTVELAAPVFVGKDGSTYVPLRFLAESLGAQVHIDNSGWITITRN